MPTISDFMTHPVVFVDMDEPLARVKALFEQHDFHHIPVLEDGVPMGVISDRDLFMGVSPYVGTPAERPRDSATLHRRAHQIMQRHPRTVGSDASIPEAAAALLEGGVSCLLIVNERGRLAGIVTWRDVLRGFLVHTART